MALQARQKWGIGLLAGSVAGGIVAGFAIGNADVPQIVVQLIAIAEAVLITLGITSFQRPPSPPS